MRISFGLLGVMISFSAYAQEAPPVAATNDEFMQLKRFAKEYIDSRLVDPGSAQFDWPNNFMHGASWKPWIGRSIYGSVTCGSVNSRNRMGGYVGRMAFVIVIGDSGVNWFEMDDIQHSRVAQRCAKMSFAPAPATAVAEQGLGAAAGMIADEITKLAELRDKGLLTEAEFQAQKRKLLER